MTAQLATLKPAQTAPVLAGARQIGLTPQSIDEALRLAEIMAKSDIVPKDYIGKPGNILVAIQWGAEIGLPPLQAMQNLAVINGRPWVKARLPERISPQARVHLLAAAWQCPAAVEWLQS